LKNAAEIISVGNELLIGQTLDTNSHWVARQFNRFGWTVQRVTQLRDSLPALHHGFGEALERRPKMLVTIGGLGPTHDDMTLRGLSLAVRRPLILNPKALEMVQKKYEKLETSAHLTIHRKKMAMLPRGSEPMANPLGTAPGVLAQFGRTTIVSLPGVPKEMKAIFNTSIVPILLESAASQPVEMYLRFVGIVESAIAPTLREAQSRFPDLYFKSHPRGLETGVRSLILLHIYTLRRPDPGMINRAVVFLVKRLAGLKSPS
jgi:nicotinamide-nucleotide amidase